MSASLDNLSKLTARGVIVDIGTGDGRFVSQCAKENPSKFYIHLRSSRARRLSGNDRRQVVYFIAEAQK